MFFVKKFLNTENPDILSYFSEILMHIFVRKWKKILNIENIMFF